MSSAKLAKRMVKVNATHCEIQIYFLEISLATESLNPSIPFSSITANPAFISERKDLYLTLTARKNTQNMTTH